MGNCCLVCLIEFLKKIYQHQKQKPNSQTKTTAIEIPKKENLPSSPQGVEYIGNNQ